MAKSKSPIEHYVYDALRAGTSRETIAAALKEAGWTESSIVLALSAYVDQPSAIPIPRPKADVTAKEIFIYLAMFTALYVAAFAVGSILFDLLDAWLPDPADHQNFFSFRDTRGFVAQVIVALPLFLWFTHVTAKAVAADPLRRISPARRWLTYITLFVAGCALAGDMVTLVYYFLDGDVTIRFLLKVLVVFILGGGIFWYYLMDLRRDEAIGEGSFDQQVSS